MQYVNKHLSTTAFVLTGIMKNYLSETIFLLIFHRWVMQNNIYDIYDDSEKSDVWKTRKIKFLSSRSNLELGNRIKSCFDFNKICHQK